MYSAPMGDYVGRTHKSCMLKVYLCMEHHETGKMSVHRNHEVARILQKRAQETFEKTHSHAEWMSIFQRNYID